MSEFELRWQQRHVPLPDDPMYTVPKLVLQYRDEFCDWTDVEIVDEHGEPV